jgi:hypothetical protein
MNVRRLFVTGLACAAALAITAAQASGSPSSPAPPSVSVGPAAPTTGLKPLVGSLAANNTANTFCDWVPGWTCHVDYLMSKGTSTALFLFSDGTSATATFKCTTATCSTWYEGYPRSLTRFAEAAQITGPNISIIGVHSFP